MTGDGLPEVTALPFTFTVAVASAVVGVTVKEDVELPTLAVYLTVVCENFGEMVIPVSPQFSLRLDKYALVEAAALVMVTV